MQLLTQYLCAWPEMLHSNKLPVMFIVLSLKPHFQGLAKILS